MTASKPEELLARLADFCPPALHKWIERGQT
jgi:hypothetical protein